MMDYKLQKLSRYSMTIMSRNMIFVIIPNASAFFSKERARTVFESGKLYMEQVT